MFNVNKTMTKTEHIQYWVKTAEHDIATAESLFDSRHFDWCLFIGHLVLEKMLKAHFVNDNDDVPPKIHDLIRLIEKTKLSPDEEMLLFLEKANYFCISARYPDEKLKFYQSCTTEYTIIQFDKIKYYFEWLKSNLKY